MPRAPGANGVAMADIGSSGVQDEAEIIGVPFSYSSTISSDFETGDASFRTTKSFGARKVAVNPTRPQRMNLNSWYKLLPFPGKISFNPQQMAAIITNPRIIRKTFCKIVPLAAENEPFSVRKMYPVFLNIQNLPHVFLFFPQQQEQDPTNLYISNLPISMDEQELENMLKPFGHVISTRILRDANGVSRGVGFAR